jgi:hypothetical protein
MMNFLLNHGAAFVRRFVKTPRSHRGAVIILVLFFVMLFIGVAALITDLVMAMASNEQQRHACEYAALAAAKAYIDASPPASSDVHAAYDFKVDAAWTRAREVAAQNKMLSKQDCGSSPPFEDLALDTASITNRKSEYSTGRAGTLRPGKWETDAAKCPGGKAPCFVANVSGDTSAGAFQCEARLGTPIRTLLAPLIGFNDLSINAKAVASSSAKHAMFALDLSPSLAKITHRTDSTPLQSNPPVANPHPRCTTAPPLSYLAIKGYYAYNYYQGSLSGPFCVGCTDGFFDAQAKLFADGSTTSKNYCSLARDVNPCNQSTFPAAAESINCGYLVDNPSHVPSSETLPAALRKPVVRDRETPPVFHFQSDYRPFKFGNPTGVAASSCTLTDFADSTIVYNPVMSVTLPPHIDDQFAVNPASGIDRPDRNFNKCILIDSYRNLTPSRPEYYYAGPEPLTTAIDAIHTGIQTLKGDSFNGTMVGLIGFDDRAVDYDTNTPIRSYAPEDPKTGRLSAITDITNYQNQIAAYLFPDALLWTDIQKGLLKAMEGLAIPTGKATKHIFLVTDGLSNCYFRGNAYTNYDHRDCKTSLGYLSHAESELLGSTVDTISGGGVKVHVLLIPNEASATGATVQPHTLNLLSSKYKQCCTGLGAALGDGSSVCNSACEGIERWMTPDEAMESGQDFVTEEKVCDLDGCFSGANKVMGALVKKTGGKWFPLRPPPPTAADNCLTSGVRRATTCAAPDPTNPNACITRKATTLPQKQLYDPYCRTIQQQMNEYMQEFINDNDIVLVG